MIKVFYDGKCGLCQREVDYYRRRDNASLIEWVDVTKHREIPHSYQLSEATALKHMHALLEDDRLVRGMDAFIAIWRRIPGWQWFAAVASFMPVKLLLGLAYEVFAFIRFKSYRHCRVASR